MKFLILLIFIVLLDKGYADESKPIETARTGKILPVFQVVRFPNTGCVISGGTKNGTCYTAEECSNKGGTNGGSCASGFGVCCTFTIGCGSTSSENCTYFEVSAAAQGPCNGRVCKCSTNICQMRLDLTNFAITGPSTSTISIGKIAGNTVGASGKVFNLRGNCLTDAFVVSGNTQVPELCGTLSGEHVYFDTTQDCHDLSFSIGQAGVGVTAIAARSFNIKVTQIACGSEVEAPAGCLQYFTGTTGTGHIQSFHHASGYHLANQCQTFCFRREAGNCRICYSADAATDVQLGGKNTKGVIKATSCCAYGIDGNKSTGGGDCLIIPGAEKVAGAMIHSCIAGGKGGLITAAASGTISKTVCSKNIPFRIKFQSDGYEYATADSATTGFKLRYWQTTC